MSAFPWIVGGAAVGLGILYLRNRQAAQPSPGLCPQAQALVLAGVPELLAKLVCASSLTEAIEGAAGAIGQIGYSVANAIPGVHDHAKEEQLTIDQANAVNERLNGEIDVFQGVAEMSAPDQGGDVIDGRVARFKNGCVPVNPSPGWQFCAPGTKSMAPHLYRHDQKRGVTIEQSVAATPTKHKPAPVRTPFHKLFTGSVDPQSPDPVTNGPHDGPNGTRYWYWKGQKIECNVGDAPALWLADGRPDPRAMAGDTPPPCVRQGVSQFQGSDGAAGGASSGTRADSSCGPNGAAPPGMTWDPVTRAWRRLRPGEQPNPGPCAGLAAFAGAIGR